MSGTDELIIDIHSFSEEEWSSIKKLALAIYEERQFNGNQLKCAVSAFVIWISQKAAIAEEFEVDQSKLVH